jgi:uncharacterized membrane protein YuzA (DUF378 family)
MTFSLQGCDEIIGGEITRMVPPHPPKGAWHHTSDTELASGPSINAASFMFWQPFANKRSTRHRNHHRVCLFLCQSMPARCADRIDSGMFILAVNLALPRTILAAQVFSLFGSIFKELNMATMNPHVTDRRHIPDRRATGHYETSSRTKRMTPGNWIPMLLLIVGGINWGLVGLFEFDLVATLFGEMSMISRAIYVAVGLSALYSLYLSTRMSSKDR